MFSFIPSTGIISAILVFQVYYFDY
uniref:Uncharacterized protein n=1 Tax=Arundo donax TaxID=35708 RepID=A0A0A9C373_ARUDO